MIKIKRALISVSDKTGIVELAQVLSEFGVEIISTGGTASALKNAGIAVKEISEVTGFPEMLDGRVKTLHPKIHGGLLALRENPNHMKQLQIHDITPIDMVVVNLYPFEKTIRKEAVTLDEAIEHIDIGGPSMLRSAAKNFRSVAVVSDPTDYPRIIKELKTNSGSLLKATLRELGIKVFQHTSHYDAVIHAFLSVPTDQAQEFFPQKLTLTFEKIQQARYGENPHQKAAVYADPKMRAPSVVRAEQLGGKELSFNNYLDLNAAWDIVREFDEPAAVVVKHLNPSGVAVAKDVTTAYKLAWKVDTLSAFGGIIGLNRKVDFKTAQAIKASGFLECMIAPDYDPKALVLLKEKKNFRIIKLKLTKISQGLDVRTIDGGALVQEKDVVALDKSKLKVVTDKKPTKKQWDDLLFAWHVVKHVKSNAVVFAKNMQTVGIGMGQINRVDSVQLCAKRAGKNSRNCVLASEAFFPKDDNIKVAARAGVKAIIQPGGSIADPDVIRCADKHGIAMVFTGYRHFKH